MCPENVDVVLWQLAFFFGLLDQLLEGCSVVSRVLQVGSDLCVRLGGRFDITPCDPVLTNVSFVVVVFTFVIDFSFVTGSSPSSLILFVVLWNLFAFDPKPFEPLGPRPSFFFSFPLGGDLRACALSGPLSEQLWWQCWV